MTTTKTETALNDNEITILQSARNGSVPARFEKKLPKDLWALVSSGHLKLARVGAPTFTAFLLTQKGVDALAQLTSK